MSAYLHTMSFSFALMTTMLWPAGPAHAWGTLLSRDGVPVEITEINALFIVGEDSTTVHLKTHFDGASEDFVWLVPVPSTSRIELSHNDIFTRLDEETRPRYNLLLDEAVEMWSTKKMEELFGLVPDLPELAFEHERNENCYNLVEERFFPDIIFDIFDCFCKDVSLQYVQERDTHFATIMKAQAPSEVTDWLMERGYESGRLNAAILQTYLAEGHATLAVEVTPSAYLEHLWANQIQSIAFTYAGNAITVPLQLAVSAGAISGKLTVDIAAEHRAIPENYLHVHLNQARLDWMDLYGDLYPGLWGPPLPSNYDEILAEAIAEAGYHAFSTEYAVERADHTDIVESSIDLESLYNPENLDAFMSDLWYRDILPRNKFGNPTAEFDLKLLQLLRQHIPIPDAVLEDIKQRYNGSDERFHEYAESAFYSSPDQYEDFYENEWFDFSGFVDDWVTYIHEPNARVQQALMDRPYLTRLATFVVPNQTKIDPVFNFNPDLGPVNHLYNLGRLGFECRGDEGGGYDFSNLIAVVGLEGGQILRYEFGDDWGDTLIVRYGDSEIPPAAAHRIEQLSTSGPPVILSRETAVLEAGEQPVASGLKLSTNRPNPFNSSTSVSYTIPEGTKRVALRVYNVLGQSVRTLVGQSNPMTGSHSIRWDGQTDAETPVTSGMYLLALRADDKLLTRKIMLIR